VFSNGGLPEISFGTAFERPALFRFEYSRSDAPLGRSEHLVIWRNTFGDAQTWWTIRPQIERKSMSLAIAGATGVSRASAHHISRLLMPDEVTGFSFGTDNWFDLTSPEQEMVDGHACYKISGDYLTGPSERISLWIDKESFLIRKVVDNRATTIYSPQLNVPLDPTIFDYEPPSR
jgi:hypothetical protein